ncbi:MAG TPA: ATP-binding protein [Anaeromyxobacteraceae bacterium]|jgi:signal transduction histidine kinase|nr:ATP-binding protein [Anaeromyxobacteraceae bacterium]
MVKAPWFRRAAQPSTHYLPAGRTSPGALAAEVARAAGSPVVTALLRSLGSAAAVLDRNRQIVALNAAYLELLGVDDPAAALGLRPGEALSCAHAGEGPDGCGTGPACASCGQAVAVLIASRLDRPEERICHLARRWGGRAEDRALRIRVAPLELDGEPFLLASLTDVTESIQRAHVERVFLHDLANLATGLQAASGVLGGPAGGDLAVSDVQLLSQQLVAEVRLQRALVAGGPEAYVAARRAVGLAAALDLARRMVAGHPAAAGKTIAVEPATEKVVVETDPVPLQHVLANMALNALEATRAGGVIRLTVAADADSVAFRVWNAGAIPAAVLPRIFQRHFTTKPGEGRGQGTWSMKLFGEQLLGGRVRFATSAGDGTWFELTLPRPPRAGAA